MGSIFAVVSVFGTPELLPHFCSHYTRLGVDRILISTNLDLDRSLLEEAYPLISVRYTNYPCFSNAYKHEGEEIMLQQARASDTDWVMHLDLDEFHQYPAHVKDICAIADSRGIVAIQGEFLDRVATDWVLHPIRPTPNISEQFPLAAKLTKTLGMDARKIMLARRHVRLNAGRHSAVGVKADRWPVGLREHYKVHHFRWTEDLLERMETRWSPEEVNAYHWARINLEFVQSYRQTGHMSIEHARYGLHDADSLSYPTESVDLRLLAENSSSDWSGIELEELARQVSDLKASSALVFGLPPSSIALAHSGISVTSIAQSRQFSNDALGPFLVGSARVVRCSLGCIPPVLGEEGLFDLGLIDFAGSDDSFAQRQEMLRYAMCRCRCLLLRRECLLNDEPLARYLDRAGWETPTSKHRIQGRLLVFAKTRPRPTGRAVEVARLRPLTRGRI